MVYDQLAVTLDSYFRINERGSTIGNEIRGGLTTFLTMAYILLVNPLILKPTGLNPTEVAASTALLCSVGTIAIGVGGNLPFALGPGMGLNTFLATLVHSFTLTQALTCCFVSGAVITLLAAYNFTSVIIKLFPLPIKTAVMVGIGMYQAFIGFRAIHVIVAANDPTDIAQLGPWRQAPTLLSLLGLLLMGYLFHKSVKGSLLIGICAVTLVAWLLNLGDQSVNGEFVTIPWVRDSFGLLDFKAFIRDYRETLYSVVAIVCVILFDVAGIVYGVATLMQVDPGAYHRLDGGAPGPEPPDLAPQTEERVCRMAFLGVGLATMAAAILGCSPVIVFLESCAGVKEGARTGLASVVTGLLFLVAAFFNPLFAAVPTIATAPVLILIGSLMMCAAGSIEWYQLDVALPCFLTICLMPFSVDISAGIAAGLVSYVLLRADRPVLYAWRRLRGTRLADTVVDLEEPTETEAALLSLYRRTSNLS